MCFVAEGVRRNHTTAKTSYAVIEHGGAVKVRCIEDVARQLKSRLGISESDNYTSHRLVFMCDQEWADLYSCNFVFVSSII